MCRLLMAVMMITGIDIRSIFVLNTVSGLTPTLVGPAKDIDLTILDRCKKKIPWKNIKYTMHVTL